MNLTWDFPDPHDVDDDDGEIALMTRWENELDKYGIDVLNF